MSAKEAFDFFEDRESKEVDLSTGEPLDGLGRLSDLVKVQLDLEDELGRLQVIVDLRTEELKKVRQDQIPVLMDELGLKKIVTTEGHVVELKDVTSASVPKDEPKRSNALQWLRDSGHGDIIKNRVSVVFGRGEDKKAEDLLEILEEGGFDPQRKIEVNFQSLSALVRNLRKDGQPVDSENLSVFEAKLANIKRKKVI